MADKETKPAVTLCPSAQPEWENARVFAVAGGTVDKPEVSYLDKAHEVTPELLQLAQPVSPSEVFRFAAPCAKEKCGHFNQEAHSCRLVEKTVRWVPIVVQKLVHCAIRSECRWWQQEGPRACQRCAQVVTTNFAPDETIRDAANPLLS
jgi:hypothetical protein